MLILVRNLSSLRKDTTARMISSLVEKFKEEFLKNVSEPEASIRYITEHVFKSKDYENKEISTQKQRSDFERMCFCRLAGMPIQYILGEWDFRNLRLKMLPPVFIPRPETEELVSKVIESIRKSIQTPVTFLEIGCGSGAIALSLLQELPFLNGTAIDRSGIACDLTLENAQKLNLKDRINVLNIKLDADTHLNNKFSLIISNPPYIKTRDIAKLPVEVAIFESFNALNGGTDGMDLIKIICDFSVNHLEATGKLWMEVDSDQSEKIDKFISSKHKTNLKFLGSHKDMFGVDRFVEIIRLESTADSSRHFLKNLV